MIKLGWLFPQKISSWSFDIQRLRKKYPKGILEKTVNMQKGE